MGTHNLCFIVEIRKIVYTPANLCFIVEIRKIVYTPANPIFFYIKLGFVGDQNYINMFS